MGEDFWVGEGGRRWMRGVFGGGGCFAFFGGGAVVEAGAGRAVSCGV